MYAPISVTSSTFTLRPENHANTTIVLNRAAGVTVTLPAATGSGFKFRIVVGTTVTSNSDIIQVANSSDTMTGNAIVATDNASDVVIAFETTSTSDTITLNGTTTGGIKGDYIELEDVASTLWTVKMVASATGTEVTPFSAAV